MGRKEDILMLEIDPFLAIICKPEEHQVGDSVIHNGVEYIVAKRVPRKNGTVQCWLGREV